MLKKPEVSSNGSPELVSLASAGFFGKRWPVLMEWLLSSAWEDGTVRATSTLSISVGDGRWKGRMNDRDSGMVAFLSSESLEALLDAWERGLSKNSLEWRVDQFQKGKRKP
jgi:hypothetical protein